MPSRSFSILTLFVFLLFMLAIVTAKHQGPPAYKVIQKTTLGGEGGWDYLTVDPQARRVYISRSTHVMVVDADSAKVIGDIANTSGVHGIALVPSLNKGFTSNGRNNTVSVFDLKTLKVTRQIPVGKNPDAIIYDPASKLVFTSNGISRDTTAIDPVSETVKATVALDGRPEAAVSDGRGHMYFNLEDKSTIVEVDSRKLTVEARWSLDPGEEPTGLAIDRQHHRLFSGCSNKLMVVVDADNGHIVATLPIGSGVDGTDYDPSTRLAFSANGEGTLTIVHEDSADKFSVIDNVPTERGARTLSLDPKTHSIYLTTADFGPTPAPTADQPRPRPPIIPGSFRLLVVGRGK